MICKPLIFRICQARSRENWHRFSSEAAPVPVRYDHALGRVISLPSELALAGVALGGLGSGGRRGGGRLGLGLGGRGGGGWALGRRSASTRSRVWWV